MLTTTTLNSFNFRKLFGLLAVICLVSSVAFAQQVGGAFRNDAQHSYIVGFYTGAGQGLPSDGIMHAVNPGSTGGFGNSDESPNAIPQGGDLCANVYVFLPDEQLTACCSCKISPNGMQGWRLSVDLIGNPLTGPPYVGFPTIRAGALKIISSRGGGPAGRLPSPPIGPGISSAGTSGLRCDAGSEYHPGGELHAWITHVRPLLGETSVGVTEIHFEPAHLSHSELEKLQQQCFAINAAAGHGGVGSGRGQCRCDGLFAN